LRNARAFPLLPAALASVPFGFVLVRVRVRFLPSTHYPLYNFDLRAMQARTLLRAALASVSFKFVLARVRVRKLRALKEETGMTTPRCPYIEQD